MKSVAIGLAMAVTMASPALANDTALIPYAGVLMGYDNVQTTSLGLKTSDAKLSYGIALGADTVVMPRVRLGVEAEYMRSKTNNVLPIDALNALNTGYRRDVSVSVRAGYEVTPHLLAYIKAGYTNRRAVASGLAAGTLAGVPTPIAFAYPRNLGGYRVAAGLEYGTKVKARLEYRLSQYGATGGSTDPLAPELSYKAKSQQVVAGLLYGF
ncbi:outer membrane beta-barrel protein [Novosphingobium sp.]|uniref:outer membrane protein n=1 Tax=Novosphingobium sp. TaxID=1874826 RepID=UPI0026281BF5|nr:outer membrane beta-barrel protein [Novosphingobium sp.]